MRWSRLAGKQILFHSLFAPSDFLGIREWNAFFHLVSGPPRRLLQRTSHSRIAHRRSCPFPVSESLADDSTRPPGLLCATVIAAFVADRSCFADCGRPPPPYPRVIFQLPVSGNRNPKAKATRARFQLGRCHQNVHVTNICNGRESTCRECVIRRHGKVPKIHRDANTCFGRSC